MTIRKDIQAVIQFCPAGEWLTSYVELPTATEESLKRSLLTPDGRGVQFKEACLNELLRRARSTQDNKAHFSEVSDRERRIK